MGWTGPAVMLLFLIAHLRMTRRNAKMECILILASTIIGLILDNVLAATGAVAYTGTLTIGKSPLWLVSIWAGFGATLLHSQNVLIRTRRFALITGCLGGPAAYWGGEKLARLDVNGPAGWVAVSATWTIALLCLEWIANRSDKR